MTADLVSNYRTEPGPCLFIIDLHQETYPATAVRHESFGIPVEQARAATLDSRFLVGWNLFSPRPRKRVIASGVV